jgi:hypothetical protein
MRALSGELMSRDAAKIAQFLGEKQFAKVAMIDA